MRQHPNPAILLTGPPGVGKTTAVKAVAALLGVRAGGFYTRELRHRGERTGFELVTLDGRTVWLASRASTPTFKDEAHLGRYRVNLTAVNSFAVPALQRALSAGKIVVIDEIGPMEILSELFCETVLKILHGPAAVIGSLAQKPTPFGNRVRGIERVQVVTVTPENREQLPPQVAAQLTGG
ncbi:MAG: NTPase [Anaerolineae bacterium]